MIEELHIQADHQGFVLFFDSKSHPVRMRSPHHHRELELNIVTRGTAEYVLSNQRYKLTAGCLVWLFPEQEHILTKADDGFEMYVITFKEGLFKNSVLQGKYKMLAEANPEGYFCKRISPTSLQKIEQVCKSLCEMNDQRVQAPAYYYAGQAFGFEHNSEYLHSEPSILNAGLLYIMTTGWHLFVTEGLDDGKEIYHPAVGKAMQLLKSSTAKNIGLSELADKCGISTSRLSRQFNEQTGMSITDFKNRLKLETLFTYIKSHPEFNINEACYQSGFGSYSQFYKVFKETFGISPKGYFSKD